MSLDDTEWWSTSNASSLNSFSDTSADDSSLDALSGESFNDLSADNSPSDTDADDASYETLSDESFDDLSANDSLSDTDADDAPYETLSGESFNDLSADDSLSDTDANDASYETLSDESFDDLSANDSPSDTDADDASYETLSDEFFDDLSADDSPSDIDADDASYETLSDEFFDDLSADDSPSDPDADDTPYETFSDESFMDNDIDSLGLNDDTITVDEDGAIDICTADNANTPDATNSNDTIAEPTNINSMDAESQLNWDASSVSQADYDLQSNNENNFEQDTAYNTMTSETAYSQNAASCDVSDAAEANVNAVDSSIEPEANRHIEYSPGKVLKRDEFELLEAGNSAINQRLEIQEDEYRDQGLTSDEIADHLAADKWRFQKEFLKDAFPNQEISPNIFNGFSENGSMDRIVEAEKSPLLREEMSLERNPDQYDTEGYDTVLGESYNTDMHDTSDSESMFSYDGIDATEITTEADDSKQFDFVNDTLLMSDPVDNHSDVALDAADEVKAVDAVGEWLADINPNFDPFDYDSPYCNNCGSCTWAVYQRLEGMNPDACASAQNIDYNSEMEYLTGMKQVPMSPGDIEKALLAQGDGAHAIIGIDRSNGYGHWFNAACINGKVVAIDGQSGEIIDWPPDYGDVVNWEMSVKK